MLAKDAQDSAYIDGGVIPEAASLHSRYDAVVAFSIALDLLVDPVGLLKVQIVREQGNLLWHHACMP